MVSKRSRTIAEYIDSAPPQAQEYLRKLYALLKQVAPDATEAIKWGNPVFEAHRILFAFSAHKAHINFAPTPAALKPFRDELAKHKTGKGTLQIPYDKPFPAALVRKIARYRVKDVRENDAKWM
ncbi:MAG: DUF1801 domain-containing protein [Xanthomonadaceae bacterium]|nr:DUF1801 domain-containing protein [Xanthomonadaceae bacterium]